jgi:hypothetical protein
MGRHARVEGARTGGRARVGAHTGRKWAHTGKDVRIGGREGCNEELGMIREGKFGCIWAKGCA